MSRARWRGVLTGAAAESTNARVKWWSIGQMVLIVAVCLFQVYYVQRYVRHPRNSRLTLCSQFEVRRSV